MQNLQELPKLEDSISYIYIEHAIIERHDSAIIAIQDVGKTPIPIAAMTCLLLGPGTKITHAAIRAICENGCMAIWCGENGTRFLCGGSWRDAQCEKSAPAGAHVHGCGQPPECCGPDVSNSFPPYQNRRHDLAAAERHGRYPSAQGV